MPEFARLDDPAVAAILTFVRSSWGNRAPAVTVGQVAAMRALISGRPLETSTGDAGAEAVQAGRALALDRAKGNCLACHTIEGGDAPSSVGRELKGMRRKFPHREDLVEILNDEPSRNSIAPMPPFGRNHILTATEIDRIVDFLYTL
jgi:sulfur-oxidizing protein SoxX